MELNPQSILTRKHLSHSLFPVELWELELSNQKVQAAVKIIDNPKMAKREKEGLQELAKCNASVPFVYGIWEYKNKYHLIMEFCGYPFHGNKDIVLKENLLQLYSSKIETFWGEKEDNFIGTLVQPNSIYSNFSEYWLESRIQPMLQIIEKRGISTKDWKNKLLDKVQLNIEKWNLNHHKPRRIHGDLWGGNVLYSGKNSYLIDPSTSLGNPEQDLAMLSLFGSSLSDKSRIEILKSLNQEEGWKERVPFWLIYPLLVHVAIFGTSYLSQLHSTMSRL